MAQDIVQKAKRLEKRQGNAMDKPLERSASGVPGSARYAYRGYSRVHVSMTGLSGVGARFGLTAHSVFSAARDCSARLAPACERLHYLRVVRRSLNEASGGTVVSAIRGPEAKDILSVERKCG